MDRRQFLQTINANGMSAMLPASAFVNGSSSGTTQMPQTPIIDDRALVEVTDAAWNSPKIGIVSVGGIGRICMPLRCNPTVRFPYLIRSIAIDTYCTEFHFMNADHKVQVDKNRTSFDPHDERVLARTILSEITDAVAGLDMVILVAGMGGTTGTAVTPVVAAQLKKLGVLTLALIVMPYVEEGAHRQRIAKTALQTLRGRVDALLPVFNNDFDEYDSNWKWVYGHLLPMYMDSLYSNIVNPLCVPGRVNIEFADLRDNTLNQAGMCAFGPGLSCMENAAQQAVVNAIRHPSLGESRLRQAHSVLLTLDHGREVLPHDIKLAIRSIRALLAVDCHFIYGISVVDSHGHMVQVNILANGIA